MIVDWKIVEEVIAETNFSCFPLLREDETNWKLHYDSSVYRSWNNWPANIYRFSFNRVDCVIYNSYQIVFHFYKTFEHKYDWEYPKKPKLLLSFAVSSRNFTKEMKEIINGRIEARRQEIIVNIYTKAIDITAQRNHEKLSGMVNTQIFLQKLDKVYFGNK